MRILLTCLVVTAISLALPLASIGQDFARTWGGSEADGAGAVATDQSANVYVAGEFNNSGNRDALLLKYSSEGALLWRRAWHLDSQSAYGLGITSSGQVVVGGWVNFANDSLVLKFDANGNLLWVRRWSRAWSPGGVILVDATDNAFVSGGSTAYGSYTPLLLKYGPDGTLLFSRALVSGENDVGGPMARDASGNLYLGSHHANPTPKKALLYKLDSAGNVIWVRKWDAAVYEAVFDVETDGAGNVYVSGHFNNLGQGSPNDVFLLKFDANGQLLWSRAWDSGADDGEAVITLDPAGNISLAGRTNWPGRDAVLLAHFDSFGNLLSSKVWLGSSDTAVRALAKTSWNLFIAGAAANSTGAWQSISGIVRTVGGTVSSPAGAAYDVPGTLTAPSGTLYAPSGVENIGGGGTDVFLLRAALVIPIVIDIRPGFFPNTINLSSQGTVPVAIFTTPTFNAATVNVVTVAFAGARAVRSSMADVEGDGDNDLVLYFDTRMLNLFCTSSLAPLTGQTTAGAPVEGSDSVRIVRDRNGQRCQ